MSDHYCYPKTDILKNKLAIKDRAKLDKLERNSAFFKIAKIEESFLKKKNSRLKLDFKRMKKIHFEIFKDVYSFAGKTRDINMSKGGSFFANAQFIEVAGESLMKDLEKDNFLEGLDVKDFCKRAAHYFSEINALHPFREGNGRAQRIFMQHVARKAGFRIEWEKAGKEEYIEASIESFSLNNTNIQHVIEKCTSPV